MDVRLQNSQLRYAVNGGASPNTRPGDESLHFLSPEEQDCLQFFENTIESLENSLDQVPRPPAEEMDGPPSKDQDIIDLVRPEPDLVLTRDHFIPDFQSLMPNPDSHFEIRPRRDPDSLPSDYDPPFTTDPQAYHPPGCIPTPVLIAQKIAENRGSGTLNVDPSSVLRHLSPDSEKPQNLGTDPPSRPGPPTSAKPTRLPANISLVLNNRDYQTQSLASVNIQERRAQMLANLSGTPHPLLQDHDQAPPADDKTRNAPTRSVSFRDPTPDKSRMEALSKLGLNRNRAMSGGPTLFDDPEGNAMKLPRGAEGGPGSALTTETPPPPLSHAHSDRSAEVLRTDSRRSYEEESPQPSPSPGSVSQTSYYPPLDRPPIPPPPEVTSIELNSYGGKSIVVNPSVSSRNEPPVSPPTPEHRPGSGPTGPSPYGGRSRVAPPPSAMSRSDLPDILRSHVEPPEVEFNSYGGKSLNINPPAGFGGRHSETPAGSCKAPPPTPAPRPSRQSRHADATQQLVASRALSPDHRRKPNLFRPQSITVEFNGRGPTDESRKAALRKLGLLKD